MSDAKNKNININTYGKLDELSRAYPTVKIPRMIVWRNPDDRLYYVIKREDPSANGWIYVDGIGYRHSTSCYAKLGRIVQQEMLKTVIK